MSAILEAALAQIEEIAGVARSAHAAEGDIRAELLAALKAALAMMEEQISMHDDGWDNIGLGCGNCDAGAPIPHSLGCQIRNAIFHAERAR